jgi:hypothetical protein
MNIPDHILRAQKQLFWVKILKFFDGDAGPGSGNLFDPGYGNRDETNSYPGSGTQDKHPGSATLMSRKHDHAVQRSSPGRVTFMLAEMLYQRMEETPT